uniref:Hint domain-containing protein n=1 Tax=Meloidogyne incognita TaxID=6306 RepID=A0A914LPV9_MELIC
MKLVDNLILFLNLIKIIFCSFCGETSIPFSLEILSDGHLILGCARPNCFGWNSFGKPQKLNDSNFYRVNKQQPDGFFRKSFTSTIPKPLNDFEASWYKPQIANCQTGFGSSPCNKINNWVGGIGPYSNLKNGNNQRPLLLRCCHWEGLVNSEDRGIANINPGNIIYGGEVFFEDSSNKRQYAFDYVSDIRQNNRGEEGEGSKYQVFIHRMPCLPRPEKLSLSVDLDVVNQLIHKFELASYTSTTINSPLFIFTTTKNPPLNKTKQFKKQLKSNQNKYKHEGESHINIETFKLAAAPLLEQNPLINEQINNKKNKKIILDNEVIEGPFMENEIEERQENGEEVNKKLNEKQLNSKSKQIINQQQRKKIICDRNMTRHSRYRRQCAEIELSEDTPVQIIEDEEQNYGGGPNQEYYDPGGGGYNNYYYYTKPASSYFQCFSGDTKIRLDNGKLKRMDKLSVGDWIYSTNRSRIVLSKIERWIHRVPEQLTNFIKIKLLDGRILKITEKHFIYVYKGGNCEYFKNKIINIKKVFDISSLLFAKDVKIGDCLFTEIEGGNEQSLFIQPIISIKLIKEKGIFAPLTTSGDIFVEGILASCFAVEQNSVLQKSIFSNWPLFTKFSFLLNSLLNLFNNYNNNLEMIEELPKWVDFIVIYLVPIVIPFK